MGDFLFGAIAGCIAEILTLPLDIIKVRMQLEKGLSIQETLRILMVEGGLLSFFAGLQPALLRQLLYSSSRYGMYPLLKKLLSGNNITTETLLVKLLAGCLSGAIASGICSPTDLIRYYRIFEN